MSCSGEIGRILIQSARRGSTLLLGAVPSASGGGPVRVMCSSPQGQRTETDPERKLNATRFETHFRKNLQSPKLAGLDLRNLYLSFVNLTGLELRRTDLEGCCLSHALIDDCDLTDANLTNARLSHASLRRVKVCGAVLTAVLADGASFEGATGLTPSAIEFLKSKGARGLE